jgi:hypothetical protein
VLLCSRWYRNTQGEQDQYSLRNATESLHCALLS